VFGVAATVDSGCQKKVATPADSRTAQNAAVSGVLSLPYLTSRAILPGDEKKIGLVSSEPTRLSRGITVLCSERTRDLRFIDLEGNLLHAIQLPKANCLFGIGYDDDIIAVGHDGLARLRWDSSVVWFNTEAHFHHDVTVDHKGDIHTLDWNPLEVSHRGTTTKVLDMEVVTLGSDGKIKARLSTFEILRPLIPDSALDSTVAYFKEGKGAKVDWNNPTDLLHLNTVIKVDDPYGPLHAGDFLLSARHLDAIVAIDPVGKRIRWHYGKGFLEGPHHPSRVGDDGLLIFDNGRFRKHSRVLEIDLDDTDSDDDPADAVEWSYTGAPDFYSNSRSGAQKLPNDNLLITDSESGRIFEITEEGDIVWDYWNPDIKKSRSGKPPERRMIYRAYRFTPNEIKSPGFLSLFHKGLTRAERIANGAVK